MQDNYRPAIAQPVQRIGAAREVEKKVLRLIALSTIGTLILIVAVFNTDLFDYSSTINGTVDDAAETLATAAEAMIWAVVVLLLLAAGIRELYRRFVRGIRPPSFADAIREGLESKDQ
jgi:hypothetical protein